ncbi:hypothetical protein [Marinimicrobium sp. ARAG 43.8]|uniref:hypothetical protein n=1 Tax=Marinimicrobium sp. ARAG 43.8 TaxID=3418719 RepID=UPI003CFB4C3A
MFELEPFYKTLFYLSAALLGVEITFTLGFILSPVSSWQFYVAFIALAVSVPMLLGSCLAALFGYYKELQSLLIVGALFSAAWFSAILMSYSLLSGGIFLFVGLLCFKMLQYRHQDSKKT